MSRRAAESLQLRMRIGALAEDCPIGGCRPLSLPLLFPPYVHRISFFRVTLPSGLASQNTCASNMLMLTEGDCHMFFGSPAFSHRCDRNSSSLQFHSIGTCGSRRPDA